MCGLIAKSNIFQTLFGMTVKQNRKMAVYNLNIPTFKCSFLVFIVRIYIYRYLLGIIILLYFLAKEREHWKKGETFWSCGMSL